MFCRYVSINIKAWCSEEFKENGSKIIPAQTHPNARHRSEAEQEQNRVGKIYTSGNLPLQCEWR